MPKKTKPKKATKKKFTIKQTPTHFELRGPDKYIYKISRETHAKTWEELAVYLLEDFFAMEKMLSKVNEKLDDAIRVMVDG